MIRRTSSSSSGGLSEPVTLSQVLTSSVASGSNAITFSTAGARLDLGGQYFYLSGTIINASARVQALGGFVCGAANNVGVLRADGTQGTSTRPSLAIYGLATDQANQIGIDLGVQTSWATNLNTMRILRVGYGIDAVGGGTFPFTVYGSGKFGRSGTDGSATAGAQTINKPCGKGKIASGATSVVITNSTCAATSMVRITWEADHGAARSWVVPGAGSFTVNLSAAASADATFNFEVAEIV